MAGFPRPLYPGDFQGLKFYDGSAGVITTTVLDGAVDQVIATVTANDIVAGNLYEVTLEPFGIYLAGGTDTRTWEEIARGHYDGDALVEMRAFYPSDLVTTSYQIGSIETLHPVGSTPSLYGSNVEQKTLKRFFLAQETGTHIFQCWVASWLDNDGSNSLGISYNNTIFGIRGIMDPSTNSDYSTSMSAP